MRATTRKPLSGLDLIYWMEHGQGKMAAVTEEWISQQVPASGAMGALAEQVVTRFPNLSLKDAETLLAYRHLRNICRGRNSAGMKYPASSFIGAIGAISPPAGDWNGPASL